MSDVDSFIKQKVSVVLGRFWKQTSESNRNMTEQQQQKKILFFFKFFRRNKCSIFCSSSWDLPENTADKNRLFTEAQTRWMRGNIPRLQQVKFQMDIRKKSIYCG